MNLKRLKYKNDWEADVYLVDKKPVELLKEVIIEENELLIRYPVKVRYVGVNYSDHGHGYVGWSNHYYITTKVFGVKMEFDLNEVMARKAKVFVDPKNVKFI